MLVLLIDIRSVKQFYFPKPTCATLSSRDGTLHYTLNIGRKLNSLLRGACNSFRLAQDILSTNRIPRWWPLGFLCWQGWLTLASTPVYFAASVAVFFATIRTLPLSFVDETTAAGAVFGGTAFCLTISKNVYSQAQTAFTNQMIKTSVSSL